MTNQVAQARDHRGPARDVETLVDKHPMRVAP
jgi:hypothetical protein